MIRRKARPIDLGDRFIKIGDLYGRIWTVVRIWKATDGLPHARIENDGPGHETRIISISALADEDFYIPTPGVGLKGTEP